MKDYYFGLLSLGLGTSVVSYAPLPMLHELTALVIILDIVCGV